jgi:hypothetical protein
MRRSCLPSPSTSFFFPETQHNTTQHHDISITTRPQVIMAHHEYQFKVRVAIVENPWSVFSSKFDFLVLLTSTSSTPRASRRRLNFCPLENPPLIQDSSACNCSRRSSFSSLSSFLDLHSDSFKRFNTPPLSQR